MEQKKIKVGVIDDQQLFRQGIISLLKEFDTLEVMLEATNGKELMDQLKSKLPDVILLDIEMPVMSGLDVILLLKDEYPELKVIVLTMHNEEEMIMYMLEKGAGGFLPKNEDIGKVVDAIHSVYDTGYYFNSAISNAMIKELVSTNKIKPKFHKVDLSEREQNVIRLICKEFTNKEIADNMFLSAKTVESHRNNILKKIGAKNTAGIVMYAVKNKLII